MAHPPQPSSSRPIAKNPITLDQDVIGRLKPAKVFHDALEQPPAPSPGQANAPIVPQITSISFDSTGDKVLTTGEDEGFVLWDARKGRKLKNFWSKKYGVDLARFTHRAGNIVHASTKLDDHALRYHSTHDNKYLSYFKGHTARVRSVHMSPIDDTFLSAGDDGTVRLWDLRMPECKGVLNDMGGSVVAALDNTGLVYAVACSQTQTISMYSCGTMDSGPFAHASLIDPALMEISMPPQKLRYTSITFSNNGHYLLVGTDSDAHYLLDAFDLSPIRKLVGHRPLGRSSGEQVSFVADGRFVYSGSADGAVYFWDLGTDKLENPQPAAMAPYPTIQAQIVVQAGGDESRSASKVVAFNPRLCMMAVGGEELSFWLPAKDDNARIEEGW